MAGWRAGARENEAEEYDDGRAPLQSAPMTSTSGTSPRGFQPGGRISGPVRVPGSKSLAQRALLCASLADGPTRLTGMPDGEDVRAAQAALTALGTPILPGRGHSLSMEGCPPRAGERWQGGRVQVGESGTAARLLTAAAALCAEDAVTIEARGTLVGRQSPALFRALTGAGALLESLSDPPDTGWPVRITPRNPPSTIELVSPTSSQEVSGLLIACAAWPDEIEVRVTGGIPSRPYVAMTIAMLKLFEVSVRDMELSGGDTVYWVRGPLRPPADPLMVEPDASAAGVALAAGCLSGGGVQVKGLTVNSSQGDVRIVEHLQAFGMEAGELEGALFATGLPTQGAILDLGGEPDLAPPLAAVAYAAALAGHRSTLTGLETLPGKESSRIEVLAEGLQAAGARVEFGDDFLTVSPGKKTEGELTLDPRGDHRMAFAFGLLGLQRAGLRVSDPGCVAKSWPSFWEDLAGAGGKLTESP